MPIATSSAPSSQPTAWKERGTRARGEHRDTEEQRAEDAVRQRRFSRRWDGEPPNTSMKTKRLSTESACLTTYAVRKEKPPSARSFTPRVMPKTAATAAQMWSRRATLEGRLARGLQEEAEVEDEENEDRQGERHPQAGEASPLPPTRRRPNMKYRMRRPVNPRQ